jgi:hypothetical protein
VSIRAEALEGQFVELLQTLRLRPEFMNLFLAIVLEVWQGRCETASQARRELETRLSDLQRRERVLDEAFLYERRIDSSTCEARRDQVREEIGLAQIALEANRRDRRRGPAALRSVRVGARGDALDGRPSGSEGALAVGSLSGWTAIQRRAIWNRSNLLSVCAVRRKSSEESELASPTGVVREWTREVRGEVKAA